MKTLTIINTIINILLIVYLFVKFKKYKFSIETRRSWNDKILCSVSIYFWNGAYGKQLFVINIRNYEKVKIQEDINRMLNPKYPNKNHDLRAILSWTNDADEIIKFKNNYGKVDPDFVDEIITEQIARKGIVLTEKTTQNNLRIMEDKKVLDLEKIKRRISALLDKTVDNGATKEEMNSALEKANALMLEFFISENDLKRDQNKDIIVKCVSKTVDLIKTHYDLSMFHYNLGVLFDCKSFTRTYYVKSNLKKKKTITGQTVTFFGYETDVELACYFLQMIERSCIKEKDRFLQSFDYMCLKKQTKAHGKTLVSSFITGFVFEVSSKLDYLYSDRVRNIPQSYGLMVIDKKKNVEKQYEEFQLDFKMGKARNKNYQIGDEKAYEKGLERGKNFELVQGIGEDDDEEEILYL